MTYEELYAGLEKRLDAISEGISQVNSTLDKAFEALAEATAENKRKGKT